MEHQIEYVCKRFGITEDQLFKKSRKRLYSSARGVLYCIMSDQHPGRISKKLMDEKGFAISRASIYHGKNIGLTFYSNLINSYLHNEQ